MKIASFFVVVYAFFTLVGNVHADLVVNGDFESGNTGFSTEYAHGTDMYLDQSYVITTNPHSAHVGASSYGDHTSGSGNMMAVNGDNVSIFDPQPIVWEQTVSVAQNTSYHFSYWLSNWSVSPLAQIETSINGLAIGTAFAPATNSVWGEVSHVWYSGLSTTANIQMKDIASAYGGNDFALDDISMHTPVPGAFLLGVLGLGVAGRKLRKRKTA